MPRGTRNVFLERRSYRRRRIMDGLRLLPVLGAILWLLPVLWPDGTGPQAEPLPMSRALFFIFGVWLLLILLAGMFAFLLRGGDAAEEPEP